MKICSKCKANKPFTEYHKSKYHANGLVSQCKSCTAITNKKWRSDNPDLERIHNQIQYQKDRERLGEEEYRKRKRFYDLKHHYNVSSEWYESKLKEYRYSCEICGLSVQEGDYTTLTVDHDHSCCDGKTRSCGLCVRGLLCMACQTGLASFKDKTTSLHRAIEYLERHERR
jgi:hypothetical protein